MDRQEYEKERKRLLTEAQAALDAGEVTNSEALMDEIEKLDANFAALEEPTAKFLELQNRIDGKEMKVVETMDNKLNYDVVFAKKMLGQELTAEETNVLDTVNSVNNAYTHTTQNAPVLVPETVVNKIYSLISEKHPFFADANKMTDVGPIAIPRHKKIVAGDAAWYDEATATGDEQNEFDALKLFGCELSKKITVAWKLKKMAIPAFNDFIAKELSERMNAALGAGLIQGKGASASKPEPMGVVTELKKTSAQVVQYTGALTYDKITEAMGKVHSEFATSAFVYANQKTIWSLLANVKDTTGRPIFIPDASTGGVGRIFGLVVKAESALADGQVLIGNPSQGYIMNEVENLSITIDDHAGQRLTDYVAYMLADGGVMDERAFCLLESSSPMAV